MGNDQNQQDLKQDQTLTYMDSFITDVRSHISHSNKRFNDMDSFITEVRGYISHSNKRFNDMDTRLDGMDTRLDSMDNTIKDFKREIENRFDKLTNSLIIKLSSVATGAIVIAVGTAFVLVTWLFDDKLEFYNNHYNYRLEKLEANALFSNPEVWAFIKTVKNAHTKKMEKDKKKKKLLPKK